MFIVFDANISLYVFLFIIIIFYYTKFCLKFSNSYIF